MHSLANSLHIIHHKKAFLCVLLPLNYICHDLKTVAEIEIFSGGGGKILNELTKILLLHQKCDIIYYLG